MCAVAGFLWDVPVCPVGTSECTSYEDTPPVDHVGLVCPADTCAHGSSGPCQDSSSGECATYFDSTAVCPAGTASCYHADGVSSATKSAPVNSKSATTVTSKGSAMSVSQGTSEYVVTVASQEVGKASVQVVGEPCKEGQLSWRAFCLPLVVTVGAPGARAVQGVCEAKRAGRGLVCPLSMLVTVCLRLCGDEPRVCAVVVCPGTRTTQSGVCLGRLHARAHRQGSVLRAAFASYSILLSPLCLVCPCMTTCVPPCDPTLSNLSSPSPGVSHHALLSAPPLTARRQRHHQLYRPHHRASPLDVPGPA